MVPLLKWFTKATCIIAVAGIFLPASPALAASSVYVSDGSTNCAPPSATVYPDIQTAIDDIPNNRTITVCDGTYEPFWISGRSNLKLIGVGMPLVQFSTDVGDGGTVIGVDNSRNILIQGFEVSANDHAVFPGADGGSVFGIASWNSTTTIKGNNIHDIVLSTTDIDTEPNMVNGLGISIQGNNGDGKRDKVTISGNTITYFQEVGIDMREEVSATVTGNHIFGGGLTGNDWHAGIRAQVKAVARVYKNDLHQIYGTALNVWQSSGNKMYRNTVDGAHEGVVIAANCVDMGVAAASKNSITANTLTNISGVGILIWAGIQTDPSYPTTCNPSANSNKILSNKVTSDGSSGVVGVGIRRDDNDGAGGFTPAANGNQVIKNALNNFWILVEDAGTNTTVSRNTGTILPPSP